MILDTEKNNNKVKIGLYIVSTPIGNLSDITLRAINILKKSDYILCEDTRVSRNLLDKYEIKSKLISNHKFNERKNILKIINILKSDRVVSLISDAGTPLISDPGAVLVNECLVNNIDVFPIPGASAVSSAVSISGFNEKYFFYEEYLRTDIDNLEPFKSDPKGELTIVISEKRKEKNSSIILKESDKINIQKMIKKLSIKDITDLISQISNVPKKKIYNYCLKLKNEE